LDLLDGLQWKEKVHVVGPSLGGMIALELVLKDPTRFASLCLISTNAGRALPPFSALSFVSRVSTVKAESRPLVIVQTLFPQVNEKKKSERKGPSDFAQTALRHNAQNCNAKLFIFLQFSDFA